MWPSISKYELVAFIAHLLLMGGCALAGDQVVPEAFMVDPPTLKCLSFRWYIQRDDNGDARVSVTYRRAGQNTWREALPMLRVQHEVVNRDFEPYTTGNLFAGSVFGLEPDTAYEVRCELMDPDGGQAVEEVTVSTRPVPIAPDPTRVLHIYPADFSGDLPSLSYTSLVAAVRDIQAGDLVLIHGGMHHTGPNGLQLSVSGTATHPIVFRGAGDGEAVVDGGGASTILDIREIDHLFFEDLSVRNGNRGFRADGASWLTVRRCRIFEIRNGITSASERSENWYVADNFIEGWNEVWYPRVTETPSYTGVNVYGRGHVVCYNTIRRFWDCLAIANYGIPQNERALQCVAIDFYNNDLSEAVDDGIESDYGCHNIRIFDNRIFNAHTGLSAQPTYGGPIYFIRNVTYGITSLNLKLHNYCTGLEIYHNTLVSAGQAFQSFKYWQNGTLRNNLFLGATRYAMETGSPHPRTTLDYNGYRKAEEGRFLKWFDGETEGRYLTIEELTQATGFEAHGVRIDYDIFTSAMIPIEGITYDSERVDLRLRPGSIAVDRGVVLPNVNDKYEGRAPDLGSYEQGTALPHYGPRTSARASDFNGDGAVDFSDFLMFALGFGMSRSDETFDARFDLDGDGLVGFLDFVQFSQTFGS